MLALLLATYKTAQIEGRERQGTGCEWLVNRIKNPAGENFLLHRYCNYGTNYCGAKRHTKTAIFIMLLPNKSFENTGFCWLTPTKPLKILGKINVTEQTTLKD